MLFFEKGEPVMPPVTPDVGLDMVLKHMVRHNSFQNSLQMQEIALIKVGVLSYAEMSFKLILYPCEYIAEYDGSTL